MAAWNNVLRRGLCTTATGADRTVAATMLGKKMTIIGGGKMCEAIVSGLASGCPAVKDAIVVVDPHERRRAVFRDKGIATADSFASPLASIGTADIVMFAVKPQNAPPIIEQLNLTLKPGALVISIMAGISTSAMQDLGTRNVVRIMPNTPAMIKQGMSVWYPTKNVAQSTELTELTKSILVSIGEEVQVHEEHFLDCASALSGAGPAYFFMLMEAMADAGVHMGFSREVSLKLVKQTALGAAMLSKESPSSNPTNERHFITSPAGTTAAAIYALDNGNFRNCVSNALWAGYRRSLELGRKDSNVGPGRHT